MSKMFSKNWQEVCLGEEVISETIELCKDDTKKQMPKELFHIVHMQIRFVLLEKRITYKSNSYDLLQRAYSEVCLFSG